VFTAGGSDQGVVLDRDPRLVPRLGRLAFTSALTRLRSWWRPQAADAVRVAARTPAGMPVVVIALPGCSNCREFFTTATEEVRASRRKWCMWRIDKSFRDFVEILDTRMVFMMDDRSW
jgi:hypothetical protein